MDKNDMFVFFWKLGHENEEFSNWFPCEFAVEGIRYNCIEQYMMAKKAILFDDIEIYEKVMSSKDPGECKNLGKKVSNFDSATWDSCKYEIVYNGNYAKYHQNRDLMKKLISTGGAVLAEASPFDKIWGIGLSCDAPEAVMPESWKGENLLGKILMDIRSRRRKEIHSFAEYYLSLFSDQEVNKYDLDGPEFGDSCLNLGFYLDSCMFLMEQSLDAMSDSTELSKVIDDVDDVTMLGSAVLTKWRGITHWLQESVSDQKNKEWFIIALRRLKKITE